MAMTTPEKMALTGLLMLAGCGEVTTPRHPSGDLHHRSKSVDPYQSSRQAMVKNQMRDVTDQEVLRAMATVPRHLFVPTESAAEAYQDRPLRIGRDQTISQPYIVALMTQAAGVKKGDKVLEVGTGSGYQAAVLAELGCRIWSIEILEELYKFGRANLQKAGYAGQVQQQCGDGYNGWPTAAPFDAIIVTAAPEQIPAPLQDQLKIGGRLVIPVGRSSAQKLLVITRGKKGFTQQTLIPVRFVPLVRKKN